MNNLKNAPHGFCLAKWYYLKIDLNTGTAHSCYHPPEHKIEINNLVGNEHKIHNSKHNIEQRKKMLNSERPSECSYCWKIEDSNPQGISERHIKSSAPWANELLLETLSFNGNEYVSPRYLEISLDNLCNLNCSYCSGTISSSIANEINKFGPYKVYSNIGRNPEGLLSPEERDALLKSFWVFFNDCFPKLKTLRVTGGEPLLTKKIDELINFIERNPNPELELAINSNLSIPYERLNTILTQIKKLQIKKFSIYTSIEATLIETEYIRYGFNANLFHKNINFILEKNPNIEVVIMSTFNLLSLFNFKNFIIWIENLKNKYPNLILDISYLEKPEFLKADIATERELLKIIEANEYMQSSNIFSQYEKSKLSMVIGLLRKSIKEPSHLLSYYRSDFFSFISEYDRRFQLNFLKTFPEAESFYNLAKKHYLFENSKK